MKKRTTLFLMVFLAVGLVGAVVALTAAAAAPAAPVLPGVNAKDDHPQGCVDCHVKNGDNDYRLNAGLKNIKGHPDVTKIVKKVPGDCAMCHKGGAGKAPSVADAVHKVHFENPATNHFVAYYAGQCLNCHALNVTTGDMTVKSGPANW